MRRMKDLALLGCRAGGRVKLRNIGSVGCQQVVYITQLSLSPDATQQMVCVSLRALNWSAFSGSLLLRLLAKCATRTQHVVFRGLHRRAYE